MVSRRPEAPGHAPDAPAAPSSAGPSPALLALVALALLAWALRPIWDIDVWWHIALGRHILAHGLPTTDVLGAADPDMPWRTFQGGYEVLVAWLDGVGGLGLVRLVHAGAIAAGLTLLWRLAWRASASPWLAAALLAVLVVLYEDRVRVRPHVFNLLFIAALLPRVVGAQRDLRALAWIVPLMAVWGSFHGPASLWGLALLGCVAVAAPRDWRGWTQVAAPAAAMALVPGFAAGLAGAARVHTSERMQALFVPEHWPLWAYLDAGLGPHGVLVPSLVVLLLGVAAVTVAWQARRWPPGALPLTLAAAGMGLFSVLMARFAWYAAVPLLRAVAWSRVRPRAAWAVAAVAVAIAAWDHGVYVALRYAHVDRWTTDVHPRTFPEAAAEVLARAGVDGRVFPDPAWGGYLLWRLHPAVRSLTDGRIAFPAEAGELLLDFAPRRREAALDEARRRWGVDLAVLRTPAFRGAPRPAHWELLWADPVAEVWAARDERLAERRAAVERVVEELSR